MIYNHFTDLNKKNMTNKICLDLESQKAMGWSCKFKELVFSIKLKFKAILMTNFNFTLTQSLNDLLLILLIDWNIPKAQGVDNIRALMLH